MDQEMNQIDFTLRPIGIVRSSLTRRDSAPRQGNEGAPDAWIEMNPAFAAAWGDLALGSELILVAWFHLARRDLMQVHPRGDANLPLTGVFATRSPNRPNPLGLHRVTLLEVVGNKLKVGPLEALDGTPIVDIKPVLAQDDA